MVAGLAAGVQPVMQELVAETAAAVAGVQQETAEMVEVQKVAMMQHSVGVYCVKAWQTVGYVQHFAVVVWHYC